METKELTTPERLEEGLQLLKEWISKEPHLPKIEDYWLKMCLQRNKYRIEKTKSKIDNYFSFKNKYPELLKNRDPLGSDIAKNRLALDLCIADRLTKDGGRILFVRVRPDSNLYDFTAHLKRFFMMTDLYDLYEQAYCLSVVDLQHASYRHVLRGLREAKMTIDIFSNAYSCRLKGMHILNMPGGMDEILNKTKSIFPEKMFRRIHFYSSPAELCEMVDEDIVCSDFGGKGPSLAEYEEKTARLMEEHRDWFLEQENICTNEALRRRTEDQFEEMEGTFRKLEVD